LWYCEKKKLNSTALRSLFVSPRMHVLVWQTLIPAREGIGNLPILADDKYGVCLQDSINQLCNLYQPLSRKVNFNLPPDVCFV
jgi:hypothetical protein